MNDFRHEFSPWPERAHPLLHKGYSGETLLSSIAIFFATTTHFRQSIANLGRFAWSCVRSTLVVTDDKPGNATANIKRQGA
jgi:ABC-type transport system involved in cytochrome c biogenesis permease subunit